VVATARHDANALSQPSVQALNNSEPLMLIGRLAGIVLNAPVPKIKKASKKSGRNVLALFKRTSPVSAFGIYFYQSTKASFPQLSIA
jgi:hypothetical protein